MRRFAPLAPLWVALASLLISATLALFTPLPEPQFHDEFSYLLAGDTFAHGRLTNPPHPTGEFFESFQILQRPTYQSKYQPGQGMALALGKRLAREPIVGVWVGTAVACAALWWALAGFVPRRWATIGALVAATHPLIFEWNWSFWGGAVAVIGGALVAGGLARFVRALSVRAGVAMGIGLFILLISRPFEGAILLILSILLLRTRPSRQWRRGHPRAALLAFVVALCGGAGWVGYYNWRVTGNAYRLPYLVYESTYASCPPFLWMPNYRPEKSYRHDAMRRHYLEWELPQYREQRQQPLAKKLWDFLRAYFYSIALCVPVIMSIIRAPRDRVTRAALVTSTIFTLIVFGNLWFFPHYVAPAVPVYLLGVVQGLRHLGALRGGRWVVWSVLVLHVAASATFVVRMDRTRDGWNYRRADFIEQARRENRKMLVIVRPAPDSYAHNELVYNDADIDASPVVWARDMGRERNRQLIGHFPGREVWLLRDGQALEPYH